MKDTFPTWPAKQEGYKVNWPPQMRAGAGSKIHKALLVFVMDSRLRKMLELYDPKALEQAREALRDGMHPKARHGQCLVCFHHGSDCTGDERWGWQS